MLEQRKRIDPRRSQLERIRAFVQDGGWHAWAVPIANVDAIVAATAISDLLAARRSHGVPVRGRHAEVQEELELRAAWRLLRGVWPDIGAGDGTRDVAERLWGRP